MKRLLKISGFFIASLLVMMVAFYLLYPRLNEDAYQEVMENHSTDIPFQADRHYIGEEIDDLIGKVEELREKERHLNNVVDSLTELNTTLQERVDLLVSLNTGEEVTAREESSAGPGGMNTGLFGSTDGVEMNEEFAEKVKSLLNLDEEELAPIVNQMSNEQVLLLYNGGGNLQKEKLLRSLEPKRAAAIITEVML